MFRRPSVRELKRQARLIGMIHAQAYLRELSAADRDDVLRSNAVRFELQAAYWSAAADIGEDKAMKAAVKAARSQADRRISAARQTGRVPYGGYRHILSAAEQDVRLVLADQAL